MIAEREKMRRRLRWKEWVDLVESGGRSNAGLRRRETQEETTLKGRTASAILRGGLERIKTDI